MNVDAPSKEKLIGIWPSFKNGSEGNVAFNDVVTPNAPDDSVTRVAGMMLLKYLMNGTLPDGTFDNDRSMNTRDEEFRATEKG